MNMKFLPPCTRCEQFKVCDSGTHRFFVLLVMVFIMISCAHSYFTAQTEINDIQVRRDTNLSETKRLRVDVVYNTIFDIGMYENKAAELRALEMTNMIKESYPDDLKSLQAKFKQGLYADPRFIKIVNNVVTDNDDLVENNEQTNAGYLIFIKDRVLYNRLIFTRNFSVDFDTFINKSYNTLLATNFMHMIKEHRSDVCIIEPTKNIWDHHVWISDLTYDNLRDIIYSEGINGISGYYVVKPAYITKNGDIFNINDFIDNDGYSSDNFKIAVVPYISLYDYLFKYRKHYLNMIDTLESETKKRAEIDLRNTYYNSIGSLIVHLCVIFVILNMSRCLFFRNLIDPKDLKDIEKKLQDRV